MLAREYNRKINIYLKTFIDDGFGGRISSELNLKSIYSKIITKAGNKFISFGIQDFKNPVIFSVRGKKNNIGWQENLFVKYNGKEYYIKGIENVSLDSMELNLYCDEL